MPLEAFLYVKELVKPQRIHLYIGMVTKLLVQLSSKDIHFVSNAVEWGLMNFSFHKSPSRRCVRYDNTLYTLGINTSSIWTVTRSTDPVRIENTVLSQTWYFWFSILQILIYVYSIQFIWRISLQNPDLQNRSPKAFLCYQKRSNTLIKAKFSHQSPLHSQKLSFLAPSYTSLLSQIWNRTAFHNIGCHNLPSCSRAILNKKVHFRNKPLIMSQLSPDTDSQLYRENIHIFFYTQWSASIRFSLFAFSLSTLSCQLFSIICHCWYSIKALASLQQPRPKCILSWKCNLQQI